MLKRFKNFGLSLLAAGSLFFGLSACNNSSVPLPENNIVCSDVTSQDYSSLNLDLSYMDETEGCFTVEEKKFSNALLYLKVNGLSSQQDLEEILRSFPTVGEATANAIWNSIIGYLNDKVENPNLGNFTYKYIGIYPIHPNRNVREITFKGKTYKAPFLLEDYGMPNRYADPSINPDIIQAVPYKSFKLALPFAFPDWENETRGVIRNILTMLGCNVCNASEDSFITSYDFSIYRKFYVDDGSVFFEIIPKKALLVSLGKAQVEYIYRDERFVDANENGMEPHVSYSIRLKYKVDERDYPLFGGEIDSFYYSYVHVVPNITNRFSTKREFPYKEGDFLKPGDIIGYIDPWLGVTFELDYNALVDQSSELAQKFNLPKYLDDKSIVDMFIGLLYEKGIIKPDSEYPRGYLFYRPSNPRYSDIKVFRPEIFDPENSVWINVP